MQVYTTCRQLSREEDQTHQCQPKRKSAGDKVLTKGKHGDEVPRPKCQRISYGMCTKQRWHKANKDNITYSKEQRSINRCVTVHEVDLVVQLGLGRNSCVNRSPFVHLVSWSHMWRSVFWAIYQWLYILLLNQDFHSSEVGKSCRNGCLKKFNWVDRGTSGTINRVQTGSEEPNR